MFNSLASFFFCRLGGVPCFRVYGKACRERDWRIVNVFATHRRNLNSRWPAPLFRGTCITWTASVISVGWDFAAAVLREQIRNPASRERPVIVAGGRIRDGRRRSAAGGNPTASASEILAHECGHTRQALGLGWAYLPTGALFTLFREGDRWYNRFETRASEEGMFGGIVKDSVHADLLQRMPN